MRFGRGDFLDVVDDEHVYRLIEIDEVVRRVMDDGVGVLCLEKMSRHKEHALLRIEFLEPYAKRVDQVGFAHTRRAIKEEGIEGGLSGFFSN